MTKEKRLEIVNLLREELKELLSSENSYDEGYCSGINFALGLLDFESASDRINKELTELETKKNELLSKLKEIEEQEK